MEPVKISYQEALIYSALIGAGVGFIIGMIPLAIAIAKGKTKLGFIAVVSSMAAGAIWVPLTLITLAVFVWLIFRKPEPAETAAAGANSMETDVVDSEKV